MSDEQEVLDRGDELEPATPEVAPELTKEEEDFVLGKEEEKAETTPPSEEKDEPTIPKYRFDEARVRAKEREEVLLARTKELEEKIAASQINEDLQVIDDKVVELTKLHTKLISDGELDKAADTFAEIRKLDRQIALHQASNITETARAQAREDIRMDTLVEKFESEYPFLNPENNESYSQDAVDEVLFLRRSFEQQGLTRTQALSKAVQYVVKMIAPASEPGERASIGADDRSKAATAKKLAAAKSQAPSTTDTGMNSDKKGMTNAAAIMQMSQDEFAKLPELELAKLRGDEM